MLMAVSKLNRRPARRYCLRLKIVFGVARDLGEVNQ
jgi:hypothetical protein